MHPVETSSNNDSEAKLKKETNMPAFVTTGLWCHWV